MRNTEMTAESFITVALSPNPMAEGTSTMTGWTGYIETDPEHFALFATVSCANEVSLVSID